MVGLANCLLTTTDSVENNSTSQRQYPRILLCHVQGYDIAGYSY